MWGMSLVAIIKKNKYLLCSRKPTSTNLSKMSALFFRVPLNPATFQHMILQILLSSGNAAGWMGVRVIVTTAEATDAIFFFGGIPQFSKQLKWYWNASPTLFLCYYIYIRSYYCPHHHRIMCVEKSINTSTVPVLVCIYISKPEMNNELF